MHAVGQQSTVGTLFITVAKQHNNGSDQRFLCGLFPRFLVEGNAKLQLVVSENKDVICFSIQVHGPLRGPWTPG
jgi:hypothetical protein